MEYLSSPRRSSLTVLRSLHALLSGVVHVGVLVPWANMVVETELPRLSLDRLIWHYARLVPSSCRTQLDRTFLDELMDDVPTALHQLSRLRLKTVMLACTSAGFIGDEIVSRKSERFMTATSAFHALIEALGVIEAKRIVLLTPYPRELGELEALALGQHGFTVVGHASLGMDDEFDKIAPSSIFHLLHQPSASNWPSADTIVLSCTAWPTLSLIDQLELETGKVVMSSNLALAFSAILSAATILPVT